MGQHSNCEYSSYDDVEADDIINGTRVSLPPFFGELGRPANSPSTALPLSEACCLPKRLVVSSKTHNSIFLCCWWLAILSTPIIPSDFSVPCNYRNYFGGSGSSRSCGGNGRSGPLLASSQFRKKTATNTFQEKLLFLFVVAFSFSFL